MGGHPYWYVVPYQTDIQAALEALRQREFRAGRYNPVIMFPPFPIDANAPAPGAEHASIAEAQEDADSDGTRSILDIERVADVDDFCTARPLSPEVIESLYGTSQPTRAMVEDNMDFLQEVERGKGVYLLLYSGGRPTEILFAGYSFD